MLISLPVAVSFVHSMAGKAALVDAVNASSRDDRTSTQRDDQLAANSTAAHNFIEDLDLLLINQDHRQH